MNNQTLYPHEWILQIIRNWRRKVSRYLKEPSPMWFNILCVIYGLSSLILMVFTASMFNVVISVMKISSFDPWTKLTIEILLNIDSILAILLMFFGGLLPVWYDYISIGENHE